MSFAGSEELKAGRRIIEAFSLVSVRYVIRILRSQSNLCRQGLSIIAFYHHFENEIAVFVFCSSCHLKGPLDIV